MHRILVIGNINHDRIWRLDARLVPGGRLPVRDKAVVLGGGAFHTGSTLMALGAQVVLISRLMSDEMGAAALATLGHAGFDTSHIERVQGETEPLDILLDPEGERTILTPPGYGSALPRVAGAVEADAAYLNAPKLDDSVVRMLDRTPLVVSQLPLRPATPRPANYVVTSRADASEDIAAIWRKACELAGVRLKALVVTDGPRPLIVHDGVATTRVAAGPTVTVSSTVGAGDRFAGAFLIALLDGAAVVEAAKQAALHASTWLAQRTG